ncbi:TPA: hypothetical protein HA235_06355 [Candidatus Woesearchaeota archaeon]|nr:hypothetical protein [uncultured archaeon]MBS3173756.1 hypothetical protein [Candidatus Woesearchaeota archaeon]AQS33741.1 hypothetical protein [uncultured archaeon]HIH32300.1 hypothetical protein [Candidatus Woesearchaeota archaeon]HIH54575.1 hypothetical protein [Candidatus Woesearchaeota archaeon]
MLKFFRRFQKEEKEPEIKEIQLSKIDKHMNLILRETLAGYNRQISENLNEIERHKENIMLQLRKLHKDSLMNPNIPRREIQIMEGNRDNYVKRTSHFIQELSIPKPYLEMYDYSKKFTENLESMAKEVQKNVFVLQHFFGNEIKSISKNLSRIESIVNEIKAIFEDHNIDALKEIQTDIQIMNKNLLRISNIEQEIKEHELTINEYDDKIKKLNERIHTITSGTDYRALEGFQEEKKSIDDEISHITKELQSVFTGFDTALRKYLYRNQDRKIIKEYLEDSSKALMNDKNLEILPILEDLKQNIDILDLKDKKQNNSLISLNKLDLEYLKEKQSSLNKLHDQKQHIQTKITHNSASLNLSEQQYWINTNKDKADHYQEIIDKLRSEIAKIKENNNSMKKIIRKDLEKIYKNNIRVVDDLE